MKCCAEDCDRDAHYKAVQLCRKHYMRAARAKARPERPAPLMAQVEGVLQEEGALNCEQLSEFLPGFTLAQVRQAVENLVQAKRIHCVERIRRGARHGPGVFAAGASGQELPPRGEFRMPRIASVWDLGSRATL